MGEEGRTAESGKMGSSRILKWKHKGIQFGIAIGIAIAAAVLFYNSPWGMLLFLPSFFLVGRLLEEAAKKRRIQQLNVEFKDYMYGVSGALSAGYSIERAFIAGIRDMRQLYGEASLLAESLSDMERRLGLQEPMEHILTDFAEQSGSEDIQNFVEIFSYAKRGGGDFVHIIATTVSRICDKIEVSEEIQTVMAEKALEQKVMCVVPLGILAFFRVTSPDFIGRLYGNLLGVLVMTVALILYAAAFYLGMKIVEIEV